MKMRNVFTACLFALLLGGFYSCDSGSTAGEKPSNMMLAEQTSNVYSFTMKDIDGKDVPLSKYKGKVLVMVNVASKCGLTPQYADIQAFYEKYKDKGVVVLGFPANNFLGQEPGSNSDIKSFCDSKYGVSFPMFSKISVKGKDIHPLYDYLTSATKQNVSWNFQKFVVGKDGAVVQSFSPKTAVTDAEFISQIESLIKK
jgi:glutathione peroxidase-family protein